MRASAPLQIAACSRTASSRSLSLTCKSAAPTRSAAQRSRSEGRLSVWNSASGAEIATARRTSLAAFVTALALEQSEEWTSGRRYLDMDPFWEDRRRPVASPPVALAAD